MQQVELPSATVRYRERGEGPPVVFVYGRRLAAALPRANLVPIEDSYTFIPEDRPTELARLIVAFSRAEVAA